MHHTHIAIIGGGFGGIGTAIRLQQNGFHDFVLFERATSVGGVWRDNHYPGAACDVPSHLYSLSFAPNPNWTHSYSYQPEIWAYLEQCVDDFGLESQIRYNHTVHDLRWCDQEQRWHLHTSHGEWSASIVVSAAGSLSEPAIPHIQGLDDFRGDMFHSARWNHAVDLRDKRVAVIGTGASAIQFIPKIQPLVKQLNVFQRTAAWIVPRMDRSISHTERAIFRRFPLTQKLWRGWIYLTRELQGVGFRHVALMKYAQKIARDHLANQVPDPALRAKLTPHYTIGCKRILISDDFYPAMTQPNVNLITDNINDVKSNSIVDSAGVEHETDVIIFGTGFHVTDFPFANHIFNQHGQSLNDIWQGSPKAHLGTTVAGFPNLFILQGPNTGLGHTSVIYMIEAQIEHIINALKFMRQHTVSAIEPKADAQATFVREVDHAMQQTVWMQGGCRSWYLDATGRNSTLWAGSTLAFRRRVVPFVPEDYEQR